MNDLAIHEFDVDLSDLTLNERQVVAKLVEACRLVAKIYQKQENRSYPWSNFYPADATKEEIEEAAKENPKILSPYTMVERSDTGKLAAIPYHIKFREDLLPVAKLLKEAAEITDDKPFARRLVLQANALIDGDYEAADIYWLTMQPYKIDIVIGPVDRLDDHVFFKKTSYESWVGIIDEEKTEKAKLIQQAIYDAKRKTLAPSEKAEFLDKTNLRVDKTLMFSGLFARGMFTSTSLPNDVKLMQIHGVDIMFFDTSLDYKFENFHYPIFEKIFEKEFQKNYEKSLLREGSFRNVLLHEIGHSLLRFQRSEERLKEFFPVIDELSATIYGIKSCAPLILKNIMTEKELEAIMIMFVCRAFTWWLDQKTQPSVEAFAKGHAIALNHFLQNGAIREAGGVSWPNFSKMFMGIEELSDALERLISIGVYEDVKEFVEKYGSFDIYERLAGRLAKEFGGLAIKQ